MAASQTHTKLRKGHIELDTMFVHFQEDIYDSQQYVPSIQLTPPPFDMSSPIFTDTNLDYDDESWERSMQICDAWKSKLLKRDNLVKIGKLIDKYRGGIPDSLSTPQKGAFNAWIRLKFVDGGSAVMRIPMPGKTMFPAEKIQREVAVMRFLADKTSISLPLVLHSGAAEESPDGLGPFIIMEFIEHECDLVDALNTPDIPYEEPPILDPCISNERLHFIYGQMADIMLARCLFQRLAREGQLSKHGNHEPFPLVNDDFRPANVLSNAKFQITGTVDWEFTYAGPCEFAYSAPAWLLLELPEYWREGLDDWTRVYEQRLPIFLAAIRERETAALKRGILKQDQCLSLFVHDSWKPGDFWVSYAARRCWAFDMVYWAKIDKRFFGDGTVDDRLKLLTMEEKTELDQLVNRMVKAEHGIDGSKYFRRAVNFANLTSQS